MRKLISLLLVVIMTIGLGTTAFAASSDTEQAPQSTQITQKIRTIVSITEAERKVAAENGLEILTKVTDPLMIQTLANNGEIALNERGELPASVIVYKTADTDNTGINESPAVIKAAASISITKEDYYDGRYFEEYDLHRVDGAGSYSTTYTRKSTANWNSSMSGSVSVGGTLYGVAEVKASVSTSMGYTIGTEYTKSSTYSVTIPAGQYAEIKVWTSYRVFSYTAKVGSTTIASGKSWYPNGLIITQSLYKK